MLADFCPAAAARAARKAEWDCGYIFGGIALERGLRLAANENSCQSAWFAARLSRRKTYVCKKKTLGSKR